MYEYSNGTVLDREDVNVLIDRVAWLRALHMWFHAAHHVVTGTSFAGDHASLYDRIYTSIQDEVDGAIEKVIGLTGDGNVACPQDIGARALKILNNYPSPTRLSSRGISLAGLQMEKDYLDFITSVFYDMDDRGVLSIGLNDQLAASANSHETFIYLLNQRSLLDKDF